MTAAFLFIGEDSKLQDTSRIDVSNLSFKLQASRFVRLGVVPSAEDLRKPWSESKRLDLQAIMIYHGL